MNGEMKVGLFVLAGSILFGAALFLLGDYSFQSYYPVYAEFSDVAGLPDKATVKLSGVEVGKIKKIYLKENKVVVQLAILEGTKIYRGAKFSVGSTSVIGSKFLQVDQGLPALGYVQSGETVQGEEIMPLDKAVARAVASMESLVADIRGEGKLAKSFQEILDNLRDITTNVNEMVATSQPHAEKAMERMDTITAKLDSILAKTDEIVEKINRGDGVAGALVSDPKMKENVSQAITNLKDASASVKEALGRVGGFHTYLKWDYKYEPLAKGSRSDFGVKISPREGRYYYLGGANMANIKDKAKGTTYEPLNTIDARLGWEMGAFDVYAGVVRGSGGAGVRWRPFFNSKWDRFTLLAEGSDFGRNRSIKNRSFNDPRYDVGAEVKVNKYVSAGMRVNDLAEVKRVNYTTRVLFEDKDIAYLFGFAALGAAKK
ncbi:MAG: MCE family protein [Elusimicrobia bacterium]|nr:MCE family protein [Elusimicrobiota bacterium]